MRRVNAHLVFNNVTFFCTDGRNAYTSRATNHDMSYIVDIFIGGKRVGAGGRGGGASPPAPQNAAQHVCRRLLHIV